jgi:hypothetical protein
MKRKLGQSSPTLWQKLMLVAGELSVYEIYILDSGELDNILHLRDCYESARTKLDVLAFLHAGATDASSGFLQFIKRSAMYDYTGPLDRFPPWSDVLRFLEAEYLLIRAAMPPLLFTATQYRQEMCFRWRASFPPVWYIYVSRMPGTWRRELPQNE